MDKTFSPSYYVEVETVKFSRFCLHRKRTASSFRFLIPATNAKLPAPIPHDKNDVARTNGIDATSENVLPYPKVVLRAKNINRKRIKSAIIADSPVISKKKCENRPICGIAKRAKTKLTSTSSLESETELYCTSLTDVESLSDFSDLSADDQSTFCKPKQGNFVQVFYKGKEKFKL